jgi:hypothetical protein
VTLPAQPPAADAAGAAGPLPDFLVVGVPKGGTTSLAAWLAAHPGIHMAWQKEVDFFQARWDRGVDWYRANFREARPGQLVGEATPWYLAHPLAPQRMAATVPQARLVALLRNPVDRAYSQYWWQRAHRSEQRSFAQAVEDELREPERVPRGMPVGYLAAGRYAEQLERLCTAYPREAVLVRLTEDLARDASALVAEVCVHIGADPSVVPANVERAYNAAFEFRSLRLFRLMQRYRAWRRLAGRIDGWNRRRISYPPLDAELRARLVAHFRPANAALGEWLGRDLSAWDR